MSELPPVRSNKGINVKSIQYETSAYLPHKQTEHVYHKNTTTSRTLSAKPSYSIDKNRINLLSSSPLSSLSTASSMTSSHNSQPLLKSIESLQELCNDKELPSSHRTSLQEIIHNLQLDYYRSLDNPNRASPVQAKCTTLADMSTTHLTKVKSTSVHDGNSGEMNSINRDNNAILTSEKNESIKRSKSSKRRGHKVTAKTERCTQSYYSNYAELFRVFSEWINGFNPLEQCFMSTTQSVVNSAAGQTDNSLTHLSSSNHSHSNSNGSDKTSNSNISVSHSSVHGCASDSTSAIVIHNSIDNNDHNNNSNSNIITSPPRAEEFDICAGDISKHHKQSPAFTRNRLSTTLQSPAETFNVMNEIMTQTLRYVDTIGDVEFDIFDVKEYDGSVMVDEERLFLSVCCSVFANFAFTNNLALDLRKLIRFLNCCFRCYSADNAYHNAIHAADALQMLSLFFRDPAINFLFTDEEILLCFLCILASDVAQPGIHDSSLAAMDHPSIAAFGDFATTTHISLLIFLHELLRDENYFLHEWNHKDGWNGMCLLREACTAILINADMRLRACLLNDLVSISSHGSVHEEHIRPILTALVALAQNGFALRPRWQAARWKCALWKEWQVELHEMDRRKLPCILGSVRSALSNMSGSNNNITSSTNDDNNNKKDNSRCSSYTTHKAEHIVAALSVYCEVVVKSLADHVKALVPSDLYENLLHNSEIVNLSNNKNKVEHNHTNNVNSASTTGAVVDSVNANEIQIHETENNTGEEEKYTATRHLLRLIETECLSDQEANKLISNKINIDEDQSNHDDIFGNDNGNNTAVSAAEEHSHSRSDEVSEYEYPSSNWGNEPSPTMQLCNSRSSYSFHTNQSTTENVKFGINRSSPHKDVVWVDNTTTMVMDVLRKVANHASSLDRKASKYAILNASPRRSGTTSGVCSAERVCGTSSPVSLHPPQLGWFNSGILATNSINTSNSNNIQDHHHVFNLDFSVTELQSVADSPIHTPSSFQVIPSSAESPLTTASVVTVPISTHHHHSHQHPYYRQHSNSGGNINNNNLLESAELTRSHNIHSPASLIPLATSTPTFHLPHVTEEVSNYALGSNNTSSNSTAIKTTPISSPAVAVTTMPSAMLSWSVDAEKNALPDTEQRNVHDDCTNGQVNKNEGILLSEGARGEKLALHLAQLPSPPLISSTTNWAHNDTVISPIITTAHVFQNNHAEHYFSFLRLYDKCERAESPLRDFCGQLIFLALQLDKSYIAHYAREAFGGDDVSVSECAAMAELIMDREEAPTTAEGIVTRNMRSMNNSMCSNPINYNVNNVNNTNNNFGNTGHNANLNNNNNNNNSCSSILFAHNMSWNSSNVLMSSSSSPLATLEDDNLEKNTDGFILFLMEMYADRDRARLLASETNEIDNVEPARAKVEDKHSNTNEDQQLELQLQEKEGNVQENSSTNKTQPSAEVHNQLLECKEEEFMHFLHDSTECNDEFKDDDYDCYNDNDSVDVDNNYNGYCKLGLPPTMKRKTRLFSEVELTAKQLGAHECKSIKDNVSKEQNDHNDDEKNNSSHDDNTQVAEMRSSDIAVSKDDNHCKKESGKFINTNTNNDNSTLEAKALACEHENDNNNVKESAQKNNDVSSLTRKQNKEQYCKCTQEKVKENDIDEGEEDSNEEDDEEDDDDDAQSLDSTNTHAPTEPSSPCGDVKNSHREFEEEIKSPIRAPINTDSKLWPVANATSSNAYDHNVET